MSCDMRSIGCWIRTIWPKPPGNPVPNPEGLDQLYEKIQNLSEPELEQQKAEIAVGILQGLYNQQQYNLVAQLGPHLAELVPSSTAEHKTLLAQGTQLHALAVGKLSTEKLSIV